MLDSSSIQRDYVNLFSDFQYLQQVAEPTCVTDLSATLIDHVLTSSPLCVTTCNQAIGLSDHRSQILEAAIPVVRNLPRCITIHTFRNCPWDKIRETLNTAPWQVMDIYDDVNDMWLFFYSIIQSCLGTHVPAHQVTSKYSKQHKPWLTSFILSIIKIKNKSK